MAVHFIAVPPQQQSPSTPVSPVRRSSRHLCTPSRTTTSLLMAPSATPSGSQKLGPPSLIVTQPPTPASRKRSYHSSSLLDEAEDVDSQPTSPTKSQVRHQTNEQLALIPVPPTPAPTPRAIRAQKRRKLADQVADAAAAAPAPSLRTPLPSPFLSPLAPHLVFPEPISPSITDSASPYIIKTRAGKRKARQFDDDWANSETTSSGSGSDSNAVGDPRPRSLAKRRKVIRIKAPRASVKPATTKSSSKSSTSTTMGRASKSTPRGINASAARQRSQHKNVSAEHSFKHVRRSARLLSNHGLENTAPVELISDPSSESSMPESIMSPLTPPPDEDSEPSLDLSTTPSAVTSTSNADEQQESASQVEHQGDDDMELIASVKVTSSSISAIGCSIATSTTTSLPFKSIIPSHISNPILKGRLPPDPALYSQVQIAILARTKPNTPSPLSLYSFTLNTPPSPGTDLDDIAPLGPSAASFAVNVDDEFGTQGQDARQYSLQQQVPQYDQQEQQAQFVTAVADGFAQDHQQQQQAEVYGHQEYLQPSQSQVVSSADPSMLGFMMDMQIQMHLQAQMQMSMAATGGNGMTDLQFAVEPMQLMSDSANRLVTESSSQLATTVSMQDVHLPQQHPQQQPSQQGVPATVHIQDVQYAYAGYFSQVQAHQQPQDQYGTFDQSQHQQSYASPHSQPYHQQDYQHHTEQQFQAQYQPEFQRQEQSQDSTGYVPYQAQTYDASQVGQAFDHQQQSNVTYDAIAFHQSTPTSASPSSHYTLEMHNAALYFQQAISRFHETQLIFKKEADEMHAHELHEFQREREEKKTRLRKTKLVSCLPSCSMAVFSADKAKSLWAVACKARMWEIVRRYSPDLIREITELNAREYHRMGLKYPCPHRNEVGESASLATQKDESGAESDEEEFRKEKIFDFELLDDDEEDKQTAEDYARDDDDGEELMMGVVEDEGMDDESDDEDDEEDVTMDQRASEGEFDPDMEALLDPSYSPELSRRITLLEGQSPLIGSGLVSTFYVPPPELVTVPVQDSTTCAESLAPPQQLGQLQEGVHEHPIQLVPTSLKPKFLVFHRPVLSLPPPRLSTIKPAALKGYNVDPVHAGRGTPSIRERREPWAEGCLPFAVNRPCAHDAGSASATSSTNVTNVNAAETSTEVANNVDGIDIDSFASCVTTYYAYENDVASPSKSDNLTTAEETGSTPTLVGQMVDDTVVSSSSSSVVDAHPVDESAVSVVAPEGAIHSHCSDEHSAHPGGDNDTEFGDCVGLCCMSEKVKGKRRALDMDVDEKGRGGVEDQINSVDVGGYFAEAVQRVPGEESHVAPTGFPQGESVANTASEQGQAQHQTVVEMSSEIPDRIPPRRRAVLGRSEILKVYAPLERLLPAMLPLARRPPRPLPLEENPVLRSNDLPYHPVTPYSWEQVADAVDILAYQGMDARSWVSTYNAPGSNTMVVCNSIVTGADVQPTFNPSSSELSAALG